MGCHTRAVGLETHPENSPQLPEARGGIPGYWNLEMRVILVNMRFGRRSLSRVRLADLKGGLCVHHHDTEALFPAIRFSFVLLEIVLT